MISRMSGSFVGSHMAPTRCVPGADEEAVPVGQLGMLEDMERFAARLVHLAPNNPAGQVRPLQLSFPLLFCLCRRCPEFCVPHQPEFVGNVAGRLYHRNPPPAGVPW